MKPSIALPHNRLPNAPTPEFSRHILAPRPIPLHTQTSQTSSLPFKPVRLLCVPLAASSGSCRLRSALPSQFPATISRSRPSALSGTNLTAFLQPTLLTPITKPMATSASFGRPPSTTHIPFHARRPTCAALLFQYPHRTPLHPSRASTARHFTFLLISCLPIPFSLPIHRSHQSRSPRTLSKLVYHTAATASPFQHPRHRCPARHALPSASSPM